MIVRFMSSVSKTNDENLGDIIRKRKKREGFGLVGQTFAAKDDHQTPTHWIEPLRH